MPLTLSDRVVIITGAGSGIGRAAALQAAAAGAHVVVADLNEGAAAETVELITQAGGAASASAGDVADQATVHRIVADASTHGKIGGLVNNAGVMDLFAGAAETDDATWERCIRVNLTAPFLLVRAVLPHLLEAGTGSIVNIASEAGVRGAAAGAAYTYGKRGIRSNAVLPGGVETNIMSSIDPSKINQDGLGAIGPVHQSAVRNAKPDEIAALVTFLLADEAINVNGAIVPSDGGWSAG
jgi:NAD(P)-dependent dehydrogenase (short-subunit alcohol dehydrogenase family)